MITSDHGNIEDLSVKTHTRHPVPLVVYGGSHREFAAQLSDGVDDPPDLTAVTPSMMDYITGEMAV